MAILALNNEAKRIRAKIIAVHMRRAHIHRAVCFSCGNAAAALRDVGVDVLEIGSGPDAQFRPTRWFEVTEIAAAFPKHFDATSGHLPIGLLRLMSIDLAEAVGHLDNDTEYMVPTGSGETLVALAMAFPTARLVAQYDQRSAATRYDPGAPMNPLVRALAYRIQPLGIFRDDDGSKAPEDKQWLQGSESEL